MLNEIDIRLQKGSFFNKKLIKAEILKLLFLHRHPLYDKKYRFSICGIFKDEARFLREWIEYHEMIGIEHFYLYNNNSTDNYLEILKPYTDRGLVTLIDFPAEHAQIEAYKQFYETYRHETQWFSFLDIDEFICPNSHLNIADWIKPYEKYPVILMFYKTFGTSGLLKHNFDKLVIEQYHVSWNQLDHCGKCFINTDYEIARFDASIHHGPSVKIQKFGRKITINPVNIFHRSTIPPGYFMPVSELNHTIQINHYWSKAWDDYEMKRRKTDVFHELNPKMDINYFLMHENKNCSCDYNIYKYVMQLKLKMMKIV